MCETNGDVFRNMSDVEIADFMLDFLDCSACPIREPDCEDDCKGTWIEFLESEVSEDA